jgi:hypothetical protein
MQQERFYTIYQIGYFIDAPVYQIKLCDSPVSIDFGKVLA